MKHRSLQSQRDFVGRGFAARCGAIAQLGERLNGIQEVSGSIPLSSTRPGFLNRRPGFSFSPTLTKLLLISALLVCQLGCDNPEPPNEKPPSSPTEPVSFSDAGTEATPMVFSDGGWVPAPQSSSDAGPAPSTFELPSPCTEENTHAGEVTDLGEIHVDGGAPILCIDGNLQIKETSLRNLHAPHLVFVSGNMVLYENHVLDEFSFAQLTTVQGELYVGKNTNLKNFSMPQLQSTTRFTLVNNENLETVDDLIQLSETQGVIIQNHVALTHIDLPALGWVKGTFYIYNNSILEHLNAPLFTQTDSTFELQSNPELPVASFPGLVHVGDYFLIKNNSLLTELDIPQLSHVGGDLVVTQNSSLPSCEVDDWVEELQNRNAVNGSVDVSDNNTDEECP